MPRHESPHTHPHGHPHTHSHPHTHPHAPHAHPHVHPHGDGPHTHPPERRDHDPRPTRRDFFTKALAGALAGVSLMEAAFSRAAWARALAPTMADAKIFDIEKVADGVYLAVARVRRVINSSSAIFVGSKDVLVVDSQNSPSATAALIAQMKKEVTTKPVRYVVNTHFHDDHIHGNSAYKALGSKVDFIATKTTADLMAQETDLRLKRTLGAIATLKERAKEYLAKAASDPERAFYAEQIRQWEAFQEEMKSFSVELPTITFADAHVIKDSVHDLHIEWHGLAHTAGDVVVFCPQKKVVATGDMILGGMPYFPDAFPRLWPKTIDSVGSRGFDLILPAHGPILRRNRMKNMRDYIEEHTAKVEEGMKAGKTIDELKSSITVATLPSLQVDRYAESMAEIRDSLFPHWGRVFLGQKEAFQDSLSGVTGNIYRHLEREKKAQG